MVTTHELELALEHVRGRPEAETPFFRLLLDAPVYAHVPISDDHPGVRLIQFRHPEGFDAIPFFTSEAKAAAAAGTHARIITCTGRELLLGTPGATLMLNPNDGGCVLYPEEIAALLAGDALPRVDRGQVPEGGLRINPQIDSFPLAECIELNALYRTLPWVRSAYVAEVASPTEPAHRSLLIAVAVPPAYAERTVRVTAAALQALPVAPASCIDVLTFPPDAPLPDYLAQPGVERFYGPASTTDAEPRDARP